MIPQLWSEGDNDKDNMATSSEDVLETTPVEEIMNVCRRLDLDCQKKKAALKELVVDRYKDVVQALDVGHQMQDKCKSSLDSLFELEEYLTRFDPQQHCSLRGKTVEDKSPSPAVKSGRELASLLHNMPIIYDHLQKCNYRPFLLLFKKNRDTLTRLGNIDPDCPTFKNSEFLLSEISSSMSCCAHRMETIVIRDLQDMPQDVHLHALAAMFFLTSSSLENLLKRLLSVFRDVIGESIVSRKSTLSDALSRIMRCLYYTLQVVTEAFIQNGLQDTLLHDYEFSTEGTLTPAQTSEMTERWFSEQLEKVCDYLRKKLPTTSSLNEVFDPLTAVTDLKMTKWNSFCSKTLSGSLDPWGDIIREPVMTHFKLVLGKRVDSIFGHLNVNRIRDIEVDVAAFVWKEDGDFGSRKRALVPGYENVMKGISAGLTSLSDECQILSTPEKMSFVFEQDMTYMRTSIAEEIEQKMSQFQAQLDQTLKMQPSKVLSASFLLRSLVLDCPSLESVFILATREDRYQVVGRDLLSMSRECLRMHFNRRIETFSIQLLKISDISVEQMTEGASNWQEVPLNEEPEGSSSSSFVRVPMFPSIQLTDFLTSLSREVNQISGHGTCDFLCLEVTLKASTELLRVYQETVDRLTSSSLPDSMKQKKAVQCYFDLFFWRSILKSVRVDRVKKEQLPRINQLVKTFEGILDPFDLHLMTPHLLQHVSVTVKTTLQITGMFLPEDSVETLKKVSDSKDSNNQSVKIEPFRSSQQPLKLLPTDG